MTTGKTNHINLKNTKPASRGYVMDFTPRSSVKNPTPPRPTAIPSRPVVSKSTAPVASVTPPAPAVKSVSTYTVETVQRINYNNPAIARTKRPLSRPLPSPQPKPVSVAESTPAPDPNPAPTEPTPKKSPFINTANIDKRPLSSHQPKNIYPARKKSDIPESVKHSTVIVPANKRSHVPLAILIIITIIIGVLVGGIVYFIFFRY